MFAGPTIVHQNAFAGATLVHATANFKFAGDYNAAETWTRPDEEGKSLLQPLRLRASPAPQVMRLLKASGSVFVGKTTEYQGPEIFETQTKAKL